MKPFFAFIVAFFLSFSLSHASTASQPNPFPVFLRAGFSSVLEFDEPPTRVVLGDAQAFQVERLERSLVLRTLVAYATSNMFVYFKSASPKLFVLTASEDAEPTYFKQVEMPKVLQPAKSPPSSGSVLVKPRVSQVVSAKFDAKKDYLTVEVQLAADSSRPLRPNWGLVRLRHQSVNLVPYKLWSERKEIQKDSAVKARFIFVKPNIPRDLSNSLLIIPIDGQLTPLSLPLRGVLR